MSAEYSWDRGLSILHQQGLGEARNAPVTVEILRPTDPYHLALIEQRLTIYEEELPWFKDHDDFDSYGTASKVAEYLRAVLRDGYVKVDCLAYRKDDPESNHIRAAALMAGRWCRPGDIGLLEASVGRARRNLPLIRHLKESYYENKRNFWKGEK